ncbi:MAG: hypothetical protein M3O30_18030 [Planctomycetota bacterium]|nr:hypothetical protein [Planctomycetota bacterium]
MKNVVRNLRSFRWRYLFIIAVMVTLPIDIIVHDVRTDTLDDYGYILPLTKGYIIQRFCGEGPAGPRNLGRFQIIHTNFSESWIRKDWGPITPFRANNENAVSTEYLSYVEEFALFGDRFIIGKRLMGYFILDTGESKLDLFVSPDQYHKALNEAQIPDLPLQNPGNLASKLPSRTIRPWAYHIMNGYLGLSDPGWYNITQDIGWLLAIIGGLAIPAIWAGKAWWNQPIAVLCFAVLLGFLIGGEMDSLLGDEGDQLLEVIILPTGYVIAAVFSRDIFICIDTIIAWVARRLGISIVVTTKSTRPPGGFWLFMRTPFGSKKM